MLHELNQYKLCNNISNVKKTLPVYVWSLNACFRMQMFKVSLCLAFFFFQYVLHTYANSFLSFQDREGISSYWLHQQVCKKIKINNSFHVNGNSLPAILLFIYFHNNTNVL